MLFGGFSLIAINCSNFALGWKIRREGGDSAILAEHSTSYHFFVGERTKIFFLRKVGISKIFINFVGDSAFGLFGRWFLHAGAISGYSGFVWLWVGISTYCKAFTLRFIPDVSEI